MAQSSATTTLLKIALERGLACRLRVAYGVNGPRVRLRLTGGSRDIGFSSDVGSQAIEHVIERVSTSALARLFPVEAKRLSEAIGEPARAQLRIEGPRILE